MFKRREKNPDLSLNGIKNFIEYAKQFSVSSLSVGRPGARLTVYQKPTGAVPTPAQVQPHNMAARTWPSYEKIKSTQVGVYHAVKELAVGSKVHKGEVLAKIRAMKIDDDITAEKDCVIKEVLVQENDLIEYGQPLFFIE